MNFFRTSSAIFLLCVTSACSSNEPSLSSSEYEREGSLLGTGNTEVGQGNEVEAEVVATIKNNSELVKVLRISGADAKATNRGVVINLPDAFFEFDRYVLTSDAIRALKEISNVLKGVPDRSFSIEGHTDYIGRVTYNKDLSLKRASSVATELKSQGVKGREMLVKGFGEGYPIATNNSELGRSRNRRVEIVISNQ